MATETKAVDLGKLQDALRLAKITHKAHLKTLQLAVDKMLAAQRVVDKWQIVVSEDKILVDKAKAAMLEGARTVAQG